MALTARPRRRRAPGPALATAATALVLLLNISSCMGWPLANEKFGPGPDILDVTRPGEVVASSAGAPSRVCDDSGLQQRCDSAANQCQVVG